MRLQVTCYDGNGEEVDQCVADPSFALRFAHRFIELHGTDPDEDGAGAQPGRVEFTPHDDHCTCNDCIADHFEPPRWISGYYLFRNLTAEEVEQFRAFARENDPPKGGNVDVMHPVCREVWAERGLCAAPGADLGHYAEDDGGTP